MDKYRDFRKLAKGKNDTIVYRATHTETLENVAVKVIYFKKETQEQELEMIHREIEIQKELDHSNIIKLLEVIEEFDHFRINLIFEWAEQGDMYAKIDRLPEPMTATYIKKVIHALQYCHSKHIWHQDIKPENIVLTKDNIIKITDFGWAAQIIPPQVPDFFGGTLDYLAPELVLKKIHDHRIDIWCVGITCYEWLVGVPPFEAVTRTQTLENIINLAYTFPDHVSPTAQDFIQKVLVINPEKRMSLQEALEHDFLKIQ